MSNLKSLHLENLNNKAQFHDFLALAKSVPIKYNLDLNTLVLTGCDIPDWSCLSALISSTTSLTIVNCLRCDRILEHCSSAVLEISITSGYSHMPHECVSKIIKQCPGLLRLELLTAAPMRYYGHFYANNSHFTQCDETLRQIATNCKRIRHLNMSNYNGITAAGVAKALKLFNLQLTFLAIHCETDQNIKNILEERPNLTVESTAELQQAEMERLQAMYLAEAEAAAKAEEERQLMAAADQLQAPPMQLETTDSDYDSDVHSRDCYGGYGYEGYESDESSPHRGAYRYVDRYTARYCSSGYPYFYDTDEDLDVSYYRDTKGYARPEWWDMN